MRTGRRGGHAIVSAAVALLTVLAVPGLAQPADEVPPPPPPGGEPTEEPTEEELAVAELAALAAARSAVQPRMVASARAEGDRRRAEEALVEVHRSVSAAERDLEHVMGLLDIATDDYRTALEGQKAAQAIFDTNVATSYKFSGGSATALVLAALQSAADAHDLARAVEELDGVLGHSYDELERRIRATTLAQRRVDTLARLRGVAHLALERATAAVAPVVESAERARAAARTAEAAVLDAAAAALAAEQAAIDAGATPEQLAAVPVVDPLAPGSATVEGEAGPSVEQRLTWLANRRNVLAANARLPAEAWDVRRDLACPVPGASFGNDWHFPRSHGRRHLGTDVFAPPGTAIHALAAGVISKIDATDAFDGDSDLGGVTISWDTEVGRFYAAHLLRLPPGLEVGDEVREGQVVGYVGTSGNARGTPPHLHLGWYVDGVEVNPWPTLAFVCDPERDE